MNDSSPQPSSISRELIGVAVLAIFILCAATAVGGFILGRSMASPHPAAEVTAERATVTSETAVTDGVVEETAVDSVTIPPAAETAGDNGQAAAPDVPSPPATSPSQQITPEQPAEPFNLDALDTRLFNEVWGLIENEFYGDLPSNEELIYSAIEGSLESLGDQYTTFVRPDIAELLREDFGGSVEGIGAFVRENDDGFVEIVAPISGQPAELVGLQPGDLVIEVDGESVIGENFYAVIARIRGPRGTEVTLTVARPGVEEPLEFTITRVRFDVPVVESEMLPQNIAYVKLTEFGGASAEKMTETVTALLAENPDGLILDLRNNPGGFLDQAVSIADLFLPEGVVLYQRDNLGVENVFRANTGEPAENVPLVVLVNPGSASASEIIAGAVQDTGRGTLIGEETFGKGSVQLLHVLSDGSELRVTIARWYTPNNNSINGVGIFPDVEVAQDFETEEDEQLQAAIEFLQNR